MIENFQKNENKYYIFGLIIWPYIFLFPHTSNLLVIGNDFELLYYSYKKYIYEFFIDGLIPLWSPTEASGYTLIFNPFAQFFYIPSWILFYFHKIFSLDFSKYNYLIYTIGGISIYNVGQYLWLRKLNISPFYAFFAGLIISSGLKVTEILRFTNAAHSFCWFSWILLGITLSQFKNEKLKSFAIIFCSMLMLLTAGYPYYLIYSLLLFSTFFIFISTNWSKINILKIDKENSSSFISSALVCFISSLLSLIIVMPWLLKVLEILNMTKNRTLNDINWASILNSNFTDNLGSWFFPPISSAEGWFYFGILTTFIIIYFFVGNILNRKTLIKNKILIIYFAIFYFIVFSFSQAGNSLIFQFFWENFDSIKNLRAWARINIILVPIFAILIAYSIEYFYLTIIGQIKISQIFKITIFSIYLIILTSQLYVIFNISLDDTYWSQWQGRRLEYAAQNSSFLLSLLFKSYQNWIYPIFGLASLIIIFIFINYNIKNFNLKKNTLLLIFIPVIVLELFVLSNIQWALPGEHWNKNYSSNKINSIDSLNDAFKKPSIITIVKGNTYFKNERTFNVNYFDDFGMASHTKIFDEYFHRYLVKKELKTEQELEDFLLFFGMDSNSKRIFFTKKINYLNISDFIEDYKKVENNNKISIEKINYNGNQLEIDLDTPIDGWLTFIDNWDPNWNAKINNKYVTIKKLFGTYKSVKIVKGKSNIIFKYEPWNFKKN